jgi:Tfp pilus assembly ATPase PilU
MAGMYCLSDLLKLVEIEGAEELRLEPGKEPVILVRGRVRALDPSALKSDDVAELFQSFASKEHLEELRRCGDVHFHHVFPNSVRFAVTAFMKREDISLKLKRLGP